MTGRTDHTAIALLYEGLIRLAPRIGATVGYAAAIAEVRDARAGLRILDQMPSDAVRSYQPYWALRAHLLTRLQRSSEAEEANRPAIGLGEDPLVRAFLAGRGLTPDRQLQTNGV